MPTTGSAVSAERSSDLLALPALDAFLQRAVACPTPPVAPQPVAPQEDPRFTKTTGQVEQAAGQQKAHPPAKSKVAEAQGAAQPPTNETAAQAGAAQVDKMAGAKPGTFDKAAFIAAVRKAIDAAAPKNLDEADKLKDSGKAGEVKQQVAGMVTKGKDDSAKEIKDSTGGAPDTSDAKPKAVTSMAPEQPGPPPPPVAGGDAMPAPRGADQTNLAHGPCQVSDKMADAKVTDDQLKKGNEPQFDKAVDTKQKVEDHATQAPQQVKAAEAGQLARAQTGAAGTVTSGLDAMHGRRAGALGGVGAHKDQTKAADEAKRAEIAKHVEDVFTKTKTDVNTILDGLDKKVADTFDAGEKDARQVFDASVGKDIQAWKDKRYSGIAGAAQWIADKFGGPPSEVNEIFARNRSAYVGKMDKVISDIADMVGAELGRAKQRIADGRAEVKAYVDSQPVSLKKMASEAADKMSEQFDSLDSDVESKQQSVVSDLAEKYVAARQSVDDSIKQMQAENEGLVQEAEEAVAGAVDVVLKMKDMLLNVLSRAANAIDRIIADPIAFLGHLVNAVKAGLTKFVDNIGTHLKKGLLGWLMGALADAGIQLPETFDLKGILNLALSILGLTWTNIRTRIVAQIGEPAMSAIEKAVEVFQIIATEGLAGLWNWIMQRLGDFKEMVMGEIRSFITEKVIKAGIEWLIGVLNPAAAFIKACEAIYNVVMFFVEKGQAIIEFVNSILDSVESILAGGVGAVADLIEGTLAKTIPLIISFLADLLGLGGISEKIKEIIGKIQAPINKAIDAVIGSALKLGKKMFAKLMGKGDEKQEALKKADAVLHASHSHADAQNRIAALSHQLSVPLTLIVEGKREHGEVVHVQTASTPSYELSFDDGEDSEDRESSAAVWESAAAQVPDDYLKDLARKKPSKEGTELGKTRERLVRLSAKSLDNCRTFVRRFASASNAPQAAIAEAIAKADRSIEKAAETHEEQALYRYLRQAASAIQDLYGGRGSFGLDVEHLTEVAQNRGTYVRTSIARKYASITARIRTGQVEAGTPEKQILDKKISDSPKREIARLYAEQIVDQSLGDVGETQADSGPDEIEVLIIETSVHQEVTRRRAEERTNDDT